MGLGVGFCPIGFSIAGFGTNDEASAPIQTILIDDSTGTPGKGRKIDPYTRQYVLGARGRPQGMNRIQQKVQLALTTVRGSSAVFGFGRRRGADVVGKNFKKQRENEIREALADLVASKEIEILSIVVDLVKPSAAYEAVKWRDLTTKEEHETPV